MKNYYSTANINFAEIEKEAAKLLQELFPLCRSLSGDGVRKTYDVLKNVTDFNLTEIPSGKKVFSWTIPPEWNIKDAFIADKEKIKIVDFKNSNLHVINYSIPIDTMITGKELKPHLFTLPELPEAIPYRTTYYKRDWGFCLCYKDYQKINDSEIYRVKIDSALTKGSMTMGDYIVRGTSKKEFLITAYSCHPSMANDCISGVIIWILLLKILKNCALKNSYRFVIGPETIGAIAYIHEHHRALKHVSGGFVTTTAGGTGKVGYKKSFNDTSEVDRATREALVKLNGEILSYPFSLQGSDERQYSAPGLRIPTVTITKDKYYEYKEYHTSLDNLDFVTSSQLMETFSVYVRVIQYLEQNVTYKSRTPYCEPHLGSLGLYPTTGGAINPTNDKSDTGTITTDDIKAMTWILFYGDGKHDLLNIAQLTGIPFESIYLNYRRLEKHSLLQETR